MAGDDQKDQRPGPEREQRKEVRSPRFCAERPADPKSRAGIASQQRLLIAFAVNKLLGRAAANSAAAT